MRFLPVVVVIIALGCTRENPPAAPVVAAAAAQAPSEPTVSGRVLETFEAPGYTYLRLSTPAGEQWAAIPSASVAVGAQVSLIKPVPMKDFVSKTLNRTFPEILFAGGVEQKGGAAAPDPDLAAIDAWASKAAPAVAVAKATGAEARTVSEIYAQRAALVGTPVLLQGKVVKVTAGVLGKNWLHLRDGSGSAQGKDDDIAVTTIDSAALGEVVAVRGPVRLNRDFGSGYVFPVMIEDAKRVR